MNKKLSSLAILALALIARTASAQYNDAAGRSQPTVTVKEIRKDSSGHAQTVTVQAAAPADRFGNAAGNQNDLARDGAFAGQTVAVLQLYTGEGFDFSLPRAALKEKGFSVYRWSNGVPPVAELKQALQKASEFWLISGDTAQLSPEHVKVIKAFFESGHGVYIWGDNAPYYADANVLAEALFGTKMLGDVPGDQVVPLQVKLGKRGVLPNHLLTTGLAHLYEGITIATIQPNQVLSPLVYGSADNLVAAFYDRNGRRAILDGGFTRLYMKWDTAGTGRYVKNAAAWLANVERFGAHAQAAR